MASGTLAYYTALFYAVTSHAYPAELAPRDPTSSINYGSLGDSWASGVTYGLLGYTNYDDNQSGCMRINHAYGAQLKGDWPGNEPPNFTFAACSGSRLEDLVRGARQMDQLSPDTHFVTLQSGGNDVGFYNLARDCIFHNENKDYGAEYPDPSGDCYKSIENTRALIEASHLAQGIWKYMDDTLRDIVLMPHDNAKRKDFKLYVLGYAHLWNVVSPDSDWCNEHSFSVSLSEFVNGNRVKLSHELRTAINELTTRMNDQIQDVVRNLNSPKVTYVSITEGFDGHRFCEKDHTQWDQYFSKDVWFWNASPADLFPAVDSASQKEADGDWAAAYNTTFTYEPNLEEFNWIDLLRMEKGPQATSPHQNWSPGSALRPFHPTENGHRVIKDALKPLVSRDFNL